MKVRCKYNATAKIFTDIPETISTGPETIDMTEIEEGQEYDVYNILFWQGRIYYYINAGRYGRGFYPAYIFTIVDSTLSRDLMHHTLYFQKLKDEQSGLEGWGLRL